MNRFVLAALLVFVHGCNGEEFTTFSGAPDDSDAMTPSTGGAPGAGGAVSASGGSPLVTDAKAPATGGAPGNGGAPSTTGGVSATGGLPATGGALVVDAGCTLVTHDNGLGQTWQDCVPLYTYDEVQAMKACRASAAEICIKSERCGPGVYEVQGFNKDRSVWIGEWGYGAFATGLVSVDGLCSAANQIWT